MPVPLWRKTHTSFYVTLLTTSNTAPTTTTATADEVDYVVRIRKKLSGFDFQQKKILAFLLFTVATEPLFKGCFVLLSLDKLVRGLQLRNVMEDITLCVNYHEYG